MATGNNENRLILVTGATGGQGGAVARELHERGFRVRALTRNPFKPAARTLADQGIEVAAGDFDDRASLQRAMEGVRGVYSVQNFTEGTDTELRHGVAVAEAAADTGVPQFVYSSVDGVGHDTGISFHDSKARVEERIRELGLPSTIFRPVFFMDNWNMLRNHILQGTLPFPLHPDARLQQLARHDLAVFVAAAFEFPQHWIGKATELAGDELTLNQIALAFGRVIGKPVRYTEVSWEQWRQSTPDSTELELGQDFIRMFQWLDDGGPDFDIAGLRKQHPQLLTLERFIRASGWENAATDSDAESSRAQA